MTVVCHKHYGGFRCGALPNISTGSSQAPWLSRRRPWRRGPLRDGPCSFQTAQLLDDHQWCRASLHPQTVQLLMDLSWQAQLSLQSFFGGLEITILDFLNAICDKRPSVLVFYNNCRNEYHCRLVVQLVYKQLVLVAIGHQMKGPRALLAEDTLHGAAL